MAFLVSVTRVRIGIDDDFSDKLKFEFSDGTSFVGTWSYSVPVIDEEDTIPMYVINTRRDQFDVDTRRLLEKINLLALGYDTNLSVIPNE